MSQSGPGRREVAYRLFAAEFDDSDLSYSESDEERAPNYVVTPTGARVNRLFAVGVLTEVEDVNPEMVRGRIVDPTGAFITYAGQYQPDALAFLERTDPPAFLAVSGKARTFEPEDGDRIYTSVRPESVSEVDAETRDRWIVTAAERTVERIGITASAIESGLSGERLRTALSAAGVDDRLAEGVPLALDHYGTTPAYLQALRELATDAVRVVAGDRGEAGRLELSPEEGAGDASALATIDLSGAAEGSPDETAAIAAEGAGVQTEPVAADETDEAEDGGEAVTAPGDGSEGESETEPELGADEPADGTEAASTTDTATGADAESAAEAGATSGEEPETAPESPELDESTTETASESDDETKAEPESLETEAGGDEIDAVEEELDDFDPGEFELDDEERREVEEEFGTEFSTAGEVETTDRNVGEADEAEAVSPESEPETAGTEPKAEPESKSEVESETATSESELEPEAETAKSGPKDGDEVDLVDAVMEAMERLDDGDGADRDALVSTVTDEHDVTREEVENAIQDALMSGRCYEPADGTLKSI
jgi:hypothetical protein